MARVGFLTTVWLRLDWNTQTTVLYFLVDLIWVAKVPLCVKSPGIIIKVSSELM